MPETATTSAVGGPGGGGGGEEPTLIETVAESLSAVEILALSFAASMDTCGSPAVIDESVIDTDSLASTKASSIVATLIVADVLPATIVTVPESAVKSLPLVAVPPTV